MLEDHAPTSGAPVIRTLQMAMHGLFVVLLVIGTIRGVQESGHPFWLLSGCLALFAWYLLGLALTPGHVGDHRSSVGRVWFVVLFVGWAALLLASADLIWVVFALFFLGLHLLPRWAGIAGVVVGTTLVIFAQLRLPDTATVPSILGPVLGALVAVGISWIYSGLRRENERRRALNAELVATQEDLVATHDALDGAQRESGVLAERARIARDVHDTVAQGFSSILLLSRAGLAGDPDPERLVQVLRQIEESAATGLGDVRTVVHALTPTDLERSPLSAALQRLADRQEGALAVRLVVDGAERPLPTAIEAALLRVAQGALSNVRQHAQAAHAVITLGFGDEISLDITDDGVGFDTTAEVVPSPAGGFGLRAIRERARDAGGHASVESSPGEGTSVHVQVPTGGPR
ncbi:sensor histidine kinase [Flexivirga alba]|uniref:Oxygen sensor histidine kinase NreB n=1 Tax=Flexivirga alba TaxID=702742 RepID=A0ABW2ACD8_9MICO